MKEKTVEFIGQFEFISSHGRLLQAHTGGEMHASQDVQNIGDEERWNIYNVRENVISIQNFRTNKWLCAEPSAVPYVTETSPISGKTGNYTLEEMAERLHCRVITVSGFAYRHPATIRNSAAKSLLIAITQASVRNLSCCPRRGWRATAATGSIS
jgi:hypothetical protein